MRLQTLASVALASNFPTLIVWGDDLAMIYNDAYGGLIGRKHPQALGRPAREVFSEAWSVIGLMFQEVRSSGRAIAGEDTEFEIEREGYREETYFTYSYSPIKDDSGRVEGILVNCFETTPKVLSERRMRVLSELATECAGTMTVAEACEVIRRVFAANALPLPFALVYLSQPPDPKMKLAVQTGLPAGHPAAPVQVDLLASNPWGLGQPRQVGTALQFDELELDFSPAGCDRTSPPVRTALMFPLPTPGSDLPAGALIVGVNPRRALDENYRRFFQLVANQVATAIANGRTHELERRHNEEKLRTANDTLATIFKAAPVAFIAADLDGRVTNWNVSAERMFGWAADEVIGHVAPGVPPEGVAEYLTRMNQIASGNEIHSPVVRWRTRKNGERFLASVTAGPLTDGAGRAVGVLAVIEDVTEREASRQAIQRYSERLSRLSHQLIEAQEIERRRIARELHDEIGQSLTLLKLHLDQAQRMVLAVDVPPLERARQGVERLLATVRQLCLQLGPALLDDLGLLPALLAHVERFNEQNRVRCVLQHEGIADRRFLPLIETTVFRVVQEALTNAVRHAGAEEVKVTIWADAVLLQTRVQDEGVGFQLEPALAAGASSGLAGMLERAKLAGGELRIATAPGAGTCLTLELSLQSESSVF